MKRTAALDPVTVTILWDRLVSIADEATTTQLRAAFSTVVRESNDFAVSILDPSGGTLASARVGLPSFIGTQPVTLQAALLEFPLDSLHEGDVIITNNPWISTAQLMDITLFAPIFKHGRVVAFAGSVAHSPDLGGTQRLAQSADVFEDGLFIPLMKLMSAGRPNDDLFKIIRANCRHPSRTLGDLEAQLSALKIINDRLLQLMNEYALDDCDALIDEIYGRSERAIQEAIAAITDGTYRSEVELDNLLPDPVTGRIERPGEPIVIRVTITVDGTRLKVDYTNSSPQLRNSTNSIWPYTRAYTAYALRLMLVSFLPNNWGFSRSLEVISPSGTIVNAEFPAPTNNRHVIGQQVCDAIFTALAKAIPDRVMAPGGGTPNWILFLAGEDRYGGRFSRLFPVNGGLGAFPEKDGEVGAFPANLASTPIEMVEAEQPVVFHAKELICDSAGPGRHRGGLGQRLSVSVQKETMYTVLAGKINHPPQGLLGGLDGRAGRLLLNGETVPPGDGVLRPGDVLTLETPGGGGLHPPSERSPDRVEADVREGLVSAEEARERYGVEPDPDWLAGQVPESGSQ